MFKPGFKGLSSYPVFLLTIVSILSISVIALRMIETMGELNVVSSGVTGVFIPRVNYVQRGDEIFVETVKGFFNEVYEIILFRNGSYATLELPCIDGIYGPLALPVNASLVYVVGAVFRNSVTEPYLIDVLIIEERAGSISYVSTTPRPPSLSIVADNGVSINPARYLYGFNKYYELLPVTTFRTDVLENGYAYEVKEKKLLKYDHGPQSIHLYSGSLDASRINITARLRDLVNTYGSITEYAVFNLTSRFAGTVIRQPVKAFFVARVAYSHVEITIPVKLAVKLVINDSLMNISIRHVFNVTVRDIYGVEYSASVTAVFTLCFVNESTSRTYYLGNVSIVNPRNPYSVYLNNTVVIDKGAYDAYLMVNYNIRVINPPPRLPIYPYFFVIQGEQVTSGGFDNNVFAAIYAIDKLKIIVGNETLLYYPTLNNTLIKVSINASLLGGYVVNVENRSFASNTLLIEFSGKYLHVVDYANPTISLKTPLYVDTEFLGVEGRFYAVNDTSNGSILIGIYTSCSLVGVKFSFKPVVINDSQIVFIPVDSRVYLMNLTSGLKLYVIRSDSSICMDLPVEAKFLNFIIVDSVVFDEPMLLVDNRLVNYVIKIRASFHNSSGLEVVVNGNSTFMLPYDLVVSIEILIEPPNLPSKVNIVFSVRTGREAILYVDKRVCLIEKTGVFQLPDRFVKKAVLIDGSIVIYE